VTTVSPSSTMSAGVCFHGHDRTASGVDPGPHDGSGPAGGRTYVIVTPAALSQTR
jgi:hypothetical protein